MTDAPWHLRLRRALRTEWQHLAAFQASHRRWPMPLAAALASGLPLLVGAALGNIAAGLVGSLGGLVFLYLPGTPMHHRMVTLMACGFAITSCYSMGLGVLELAIAGLGVPRHGLRARREFQGWRLLRVLALGPR